MKVHVRWAFWVLAAHTGMAIAGDGLMAPAVDSWWPGWQARIALQTTQGSALQTSRLLPTDNRPRALFGAAFLGDYNFARPWFGTFRATSGLVAGSLGGAPQLMAGGASPLGLALFSRAAPSAWGGGTAPEAVATVPYLGLGFSRPALRDGLSIVADVGVVAESPANLGNLGRAVFGNAGVENALRDMRLSPMWQLGVRYAF
jgi:hypothetical protein